MKYDFTFHNPTKIIFGKDSLKHLKEELDNYGSNVLLVYGGGSIKKIGLYDKVINILKKASKNIFELEGVMPNPTYEKMLEGASIAKNNKIDLILAVGGGSVIDCAKGISASAYCETDPWETYYMKEEEPICKVIPIGSILTMTGTGSEMNGGSVITNTDLKLKNGKVFGPRMHPKFSLLNPELTYSVPKYQMVSGIFDIFSHLMEQYFSGEDDCTSDYVLEGVMKSLINSTRKAIINPEDYEARSNIMWCSTLALNYICGASKEQDWEVHMIEHQLGAHTNCAHGMGLAAISVPYYKYIYKYGLKKFVRYAINVWNIDPINKEDNEIALLGIEALADFIKECGMATNITELGANKDMIKDIADSCILGGGYKKLNKKDIFEILNLSL